MEVIRLIYFRVDLDTVNLDSVDRAWQRWHGYGYDPSK